MRRGLVHLLAWSLATGGAVTLSWWGVHTVMTETAYDPPRALPVTAGAGDDDGPPLVSSTRRPMPRPTPSTTPSPSSVLSPPDRVHSYGTDGGRAVFDLGGESGALVSASPRPGWSMRVWRTETWIRVEFASGEDRVSVFCAWHDGPPRVDVAEYSY